MNRQELIEKIADLTGETKASSGRFLEAFIDTIQSAVANGDKVSLIRVKTNKRHFSRLRNDDNQVKS